ncbi:MAG TPA: hypothetical protein VE967_01335 [Gemmatimonadaceae bacterium]|nr:hypothetical protein [Gemmatimonadaceae bacterium]
MDAPTTLRLPASLPACGIDTVLVALARTAHVATGFEYADDCRDRFLPVDVTYDLSGRTAVTTREALDQLVALVPDYAWKDMDGVAVVRSRKAWADSSNALNARMAAFRFADTTLSETMAALLRLPARDSRLDTQHFTLAFNGGTVTEALNALVRARGHVGWKAGVLYHGSLSDPAPSLQVSVRTFNAGDRAPDEGALSMATPVPRFLSGN